MTTPRATTTTTFEDHRSSRRRLSDLLVTLEAVAHNVALLEGWGRALARTVERDGRVFVLAHEVDAPVAAELVRTLNVLAFDHIAVHLEWDPPPGEDGASLRARHRMWSLTNEVRRRSNHGDVLMTLCAVPSWPAATLLLTAASEAGLATWALTGAASIDLGTRSDALLAVPSRHIASVVEAHLVAAHVMCGAFAEELGFRVAPALA
jgi:D-sedoheptulose 7-phosphate isomerase